MPATMRACSYKTTHRRAESTNIECAQTRPKPGSLYAYDVPHHIPTLTMPVCAKTKAGQAKPFPSSGRTKL